MEQLNLTSSVERNSTGCPSIDDFRNQFYSTAFSIITVIGLVGNGFALVVLIKTRHQTSPFDVCMVNLAISDLLFVLTLPLRILFSVKKGQWDMGDFLCRISSYTFYVNLYSSIYFMAAMSVIRFIAIVFPIHSMGMVTVNRVRLVCLGVWVLSCISTSPFLMTGQHFDSVTNKTKCFEPLRGHDNWEKLWKMNYLSLVLGFGLPFLVILICYVGIIHALWFRTQVARRPRDMDTKAIRMIAIVLLTFLVCFTPYHIQRTVHLGMVMGSSTCTEKIRMQKSVVVTLCLASANSCFDPLLYFFSGETFRSRMSLLRLKCKILLTA